MRSPPRTYNTNIMLNEKVKKRLAGTCSPLEEHVLTLWYEGMEPKAIAKKLKTGVEDVERALNRGHDNMIMGELQAMSITGKTQIVFEKGTKGRVRCTITNVQEGQGGDVLTAFKRALGSLLERF